VTQINLQNVLVLKSSDAKRCSLLYHIEPMLVAGVETGNRFMYSPSGLFLTPLARNTKAAIVNKMKTKTKFLGKLMAKSLMDSRMVSRNMTQRNISLVRQDKIPTEDFTKYRYSDHG